jgi:NAD(P)-dependent dehydrogenase (short-subunit alcohol dehydrogenase family)
MHPSPETKKGIRMSSEAQKKVAIVTAGGSGMGAAAARKLADDGFRVAILSSSGKGEALAQELGGIGVTGSNQSNDDIKRLVDKVTDTWGRVDVLVNSAGHGPAHRSSRSPTKTGTAAWTSTC